MSKMGRLNLELEEQAQQLGFRSLQDALQAGYEPLGNHLYLSVEKARQNKLEELMGRIDNIIDYIKFACEEDEKREEIIGELLDLERVARSWF